MGSRHSVTGTQIPSLSVLSEYVKNALHSLIVPRPDNRPAQNESISKYMTKFNRRASEPYTLITPLTPLAELAEFLQDNIFALGAAFLFEF